MKGLQNATMLYRKGTKELIHGVHVDMVVVDAHEVDEYLADGWHRTPTEVREWASGGAMRKAADEEELERAREAGARAAREEEAQRERAAQLQEAYEAGQRAERERLASEAAAKADKKGAGKQSA